MSIVPISNLIVQIPVNSILDSRLESIMSLVVLLALPGVFKDSAHADAARLPLVYM